MAGNHGGSGRNVVVRDGLPANDRQYYKGRSVEGVVARRDRRCPAL